MHPIRKFTNSLYAYISNKLYSLNHRKKRIVVYTCIFGDYEAIKEPIYHCHHVEYILFTDNPYLTSKTWTIKLVKEENINVRRLSRKPKILPHQYLPEHDISIYIDGSIELRSRNIHRLAQTCLKNKDIALFKHYKRNCLYAESDFCVFVGKERQDIAEQQMGRYRQEGFPPGYGLFENAFIVRKNTAQIQNLNEFWWQEYSDGSQRDQLSLMYCLWRNGVEANTIKGKQFRKCKFLRFYKHAYVAHI